MERLASLSRNVSEMPLGGHDMTHVIWSHCSPLWLQPPGACDHLKGSWGSGGAFHKTDVGVCGV